MRVLLAGFGRVGRTFAIQLLDSRDRLRREVGIDYELAGIATSRGAWLPGDAPHEQVRRALGEEPIDRLPGRYEQWTSELAIRQIPADILVEATSGSLETGEPGITNVRAALQCEMQVVAASKGAFVLHWPEIRQLAARQGRQVRVGAAAGAALPTIDLARYGLAGTTIQSVDGILNGTSNYILTRMASHESTFEEALRDAQAIGVAESDPRMDVEGIDTACKLVIIANAALGADLQLSDVHISGITALDASHLERAARRGRTIRLLGTLRREGAAWRARVEPTPLRPSHPLASVGGLEKGVSYVADTMARVTVVGGRSDPSGAAAALVRDIVNLSRAPSG